MRAHIQVPICHVCGSCAMGDFPQEAHVLVKKNKQILILIVSVNPCKYSRTTCP